ncbi:unnamed protein product [Parnassius apollo]|uniref:(apollo) hypothetical protein n=1 Tax=Parnassius apollo TaxID=110799 RepID=A0A8S3W0L4_PARAO|nr:unnamed protein product [Parnassius apollo]
MTRRRRPRSPDCLNVFNSEFVNKMRIEILDIIRNEVAGIIKDLICKEFRAVRDNISELEKSVKYVGDKYDDIVKSLSIATEDTNYLKTENSSLRSDLKDMQKKDLDNGARFC